MWSLCWEKGVKKKGEKSHLPMEKNLPDRPGGNGGHLAFNDQHCSPNAVSNVAQSTSIATKTSRSCPKETGNGALAIARGVEGRDEPIISMIRKKAP